jgi:hypothetical protein
MYRDKYATFKGRHDQGAIRDSRDEKYYVNPHHPEHENWVKQQKHGNGPMKEKGRGNGNAQGNERGNGNTRNNGHGNERR